MADEEINEWGVVSDVNDKLIRRRMEPLEDREEMIIQALVEAINKKSKL